MENIHFSSDVINSLVYILSGFIQILLDQHWADELEDIGITFQEFQFISYSIIFSQLAIQLLSRVDNCLVLYIFLKKNGRLRINKHM